MRNAKQSQQIHADNPRSIISRDIKAAEFLRVEARMKRADSKLWPPLQQASHMSCSEINEGCTIIHTPTHAHEVKRDLLQNLRKLFDVFACGGVAVAAETSEQSRSDDDDKPNDENVCKRRQLMQRFLVAN